MSRKALKPTNTPMERERTHITKVQK